jgi:hypothetical protein
MFKTEMFIRSAPAVAISVVLTGCAVTPTVEYRRITDPAQLQGDEVTTYAFQRTMVQVDAVTDAKTGKAGNALRFTPMLIEETSFKVALRPANKPGVRTHLNVSKFENTDLVKDIGVEVIDKRVELINKVGALVAKVVPLIGFDTSKGLRPENLPIDLNMQVVLAGNKIERDAAQGVMAGNGIEIDFGPIPVDALPMSAFPDGKVDSGFLYAACRPATIRMKDFDQRTVTHVVRVSDSRYFQRVTMPLKGKVTMHSECGASVTADKDHGVSSGADLADAFVSQAKAIKDAFDAASKKD